MSRNVARLTASDHTIEQIERLAQNMGAWETRFCHAMAD
jgi:hypothetical protein